MKKTIFILSIFFGCKIFLVQAEERNLLASLHNEQEMSEILLPGKGWITFPAYADREAWEGIPGKM